ncbi:uncharacterized protein LOC106639028 [Copidosoma floridanum]|uniref:uncharacterized protein LOC106639028 n=1 Tax=Copidosoma floridanum TaxID=29053 RepID=UPI000C6F89D4|nr:uncharacterized protein LOC106639028 [Copidosoma floridanum]
MTQGSLHWQGTQRRAYAPGANWNVQVVRSKATTRCLWHACKALGVGLLLMLLGACMATIGYYADQLSVAQEIRGNLTVRVKNESRGIHLNNLSYAGPIVMGFGGFIVVAACVMTFEARNSAAKVMPARFRFNNAQQTQSVKTGAKNHQRSRKSTSSQTSKWDHQLGLFRTNRSPSPSLRESSRRRQLLTAEFVQFSKALEDRGVTRPIKRSPSAPVLDAHKKSPTRLGTARGARQSGRYAGSSTAGRCALLNPELLKRHAISVDNPGYSPHQVGSSTIRYPDDFVPRKRNSIDMRILEDLTTRDLAKVSPRDFRKISSPNFRKMSLDRIGGERRLEKTLGSRKASLESRRSPDLRKSDYRKYSIERFTADCAKYLAEGLEGKARANSGENLQRRPRHPKLYHSRSDDNRRRSFDRHRGDSQSSRYSLNTQFYSILAN